MYTLTFTKNIEYFPWVATKLLKKPAIGTYFTHKNKYLWTF